jgi:hypothetical protein
MSKSRSEANSNARRTNRTPAASMKVPIMTGPGGGHTNPGPSAQAQGCAALGETKVIFTDTSGVGKGVPQSSPCGRASYWLVLFPNLYRGAQPEGSAGREHQTRTDAPLDLCQHRMGGLCRRHDVADASRAHSLMGGAHPANRHTRHRMDARVVREGLPPTDQVTGAHQTRRRDDAALFIRAGARFWAARGV